MTIIANGHTYTLEKDTSLNDFIESLNHSLSLVVVEHNGNALSPSEARACILKQDDLLEIVRIVAGG